MCQTYQNEARRLRNVADGCRDEAAAARAAGDLAAWQCARAFARDLDARAAAIEARLQGRETA